MERLEAIEAEIAENQNEYETSADAKTRLGRRWDLVFARARVVAKGKDADERKAAALVAAASFEDEDGNLYERLTEAESLYAACYVADRSREKRIGIGQSILKAQGRA